MANFNLKATVTWTPRGDFGRFIESRITPAVRAAVKESADEVVKEAKALCPVRTGDLRDSIKPEIEDKEKTVVGYVVAGMPYASFVEYGYGRRGAASAGAGPFNYGDRAGAAAQPFMRPALDSAREKIRSEFKSNLSAALKT